MAVNITGSYGINKEIRAESKIGWVTMKWLASAVVCELPTLLKVNAFPHSQWLQMLLFIILNAVLTVFLISHPNTNPGKMMWEVVFYSLGVHKTKYRSIDYYIR